ncbi:MAG: HAMP domain-containing sensor histidine kinase [Desulfobacca sp.]|nr:HAMP domain-containing sensor histidine kinase [Desulfobacca sp.]
MEQLAKECKQPVVLEPAPPKTAWFYPWVGLLLGGLVGLFLAYPLPIVIQRMYGFICFKEPLRLGQAIFLSLNSEQWLAILVYTLAGAIFGAVLGVAWQHLKENRQRLKTLSQQFEIQVATLRHHYKNLTIGIRGFAKRVRKKLTILDESFRQCARVNCATYQDFYQEYEALKQNVEVLEDAAQRLTQTLDEELQFLKALTSDSLTPIYDDFYGLLRRSIHDLLRLRFRDKNIRMEINGQPLEKCQDSLYFAFEPHTMEVILQNILSNSMKFGDFIQVGVSERDRWVRVEVRDNGPGLEMARLKHCLMGPGDPEVSDSSHLGLKVTLHLLAKAGGRLSVWSEPGAGATFILELYKPKKPNTK